MSEHAEANGVSADGSNNITRNAMTLLPALHNKACEEGRLAA